MLMFLGVSLSHIPQLGMTLTWPNVLASDLASGALRANGTATASSSTLLHFHDWQLDMVGSMVYLGSLPGYMAAGWIGSNLGRRSSMLYATFPGFLGWTLIALASNVDAIIAGRFFTGVAMGMATVSCRTYLVEIADTEIRGVANMMASSMLELGGLLTIGLGLVLPHYHIPFLVVAILLYFCLFVVPFLPESPTYLAVRERPQEALRVLLRLRGRHVDLRRELSLLKRENDRVEAPGWGALLTYSFALRRMAVCVGAFFVYSFCGTEVIRANATRMIQASGVASDADVSAMMVFVLSLCGNVVMTLTIDRLGRRRCFMLSLSILAVVYTVLGLSFHVADTPDPTKVLLKQANAGQVYSTSWNAIQWVRLVMLLMAPFAISLGAGPIPWIVSAELFPTTIRSQAMSVCNVLGSCLAFLPLQLYSPMLTHLTKAGLYWTYAATSALGILFTLSCLPETGRRNVW